MTARLQYYLRTSVRGYRVAFSDLSTAAGVAVGLTGAAGKLVKLRHLQVSKPSVAITPLQLEKLSSASTGGTYTTPTPVPLRSSWPAASAVLKLYTAAPTKGTLLDQLQEIDLDTTDTLNEFYADAGEGLTPTLRSASEELVLVVPGSGVLNGYLEWTEEP